MLLLYVVLVYSSTIKLYTWFGGWKLFHGSGEKRDSCHQWIWETRFPDRNHKKDMSEQMRSISWVFSSGTFTLSEMAQWGSVFITITCGDDIKLYIQQKMVALIPFFELSWGWEPFQIFLRSIWGVGLGFHNDNDVMWQQHCIGKNGIFLFLSWMVTVLIYIEEIRNHKKDGL